MALHDGNWEFVYFLTVVAPLCIEIARFTS